MEDGRPCCYGAHYKEWSGLRRKLMLIQTIKLIADFMNMQTTHTVTGRLDRQHCVHIVDLSIDWCHCMYVYGGQNTRPEVLNLNHVQRRPQHIYRPQPVLLPNVTA